MHFTATADTDIGISKSTNQDSILIRQSGYDGGEVLLAVVCDGMGGLAKGELASATVIRAFDKWFDNDLPYELVNVDMNVIGGKWELMLKSLNIDIGEYGDSCHISLGTTFTGILFIKDRYLIAHVGDTRVYYIGDKMNQLTSDHTFVAREIRRGNMTPEQAKHDRRRNLLLQCVGASASIAPQILEGKTAKGVYLICSDGFRHEITEEEMLASLALGTLNGKKAMHEKACYLIDKVKERKEKDNISVVLIKAE